MITKKKDLIKIALGQKTFSCSQFSRGIKCIENQMFNEINFDTKTEIKQLIETN